MVSGYCVKCKKKGVELKDPAVHQTKKGGFMAKGACPVCSTTICCIMSQANAEKAIAAGVKKAY
ncbi:MAG TPA: DUF5679 domain-containing protein [Alphaproteobacteria bacterium]|nr:DUF5679 domain-containing protein [Alphaproteobacteria bacterium]